MSWFDDSARSALIANDLGLNIHALVQNADDGNRGVTAVDVVDDMAALGKFAVAGEEGVAVFAEGRVVGNEVEGVIQLLDVQIALRLAPLLFAIQGDGVKIALGFAR